MVDKYGFALLLRGKKHIDIYMDTKNLTNYQDIKQIITEYFSYKTIVEKNNIIYFIENDTCDISWNNIFNSKFK